MARAKSDSSANRRNRARNARENKATGVVQLLIRDPTRAARVLEKDLELGGDPDVIFGLLDAVESIVRLRGLDLSAQVRALRMRLERRLR
jgi:hypothetical protein